MNPQTTYELGIAAENQALAFLAQQGLQLIIRNYRCYSGEIDLIMRDQRDVVFVEVRKRTWQDYGTALESITYGKRKKLIRAATHFLQLKRWLYKINSRFDVVLIQHQDEIEWIKHAFEV